MKKGKSSDKIDFLITVGSSYVRDVQIQFAEIDQEVDLDSDLFENNEYRWRDGRGELVLGRYAASSKAEAIRLAASHNEIAQSFLQAYELKSATHQEEPVLEENSSDLQINTYKIELYATCTDADALSLHKSLAQAIHNGFELTEDCAVYGVAVRKSASHGLPTSSDN